METEWYEFSRRKPPKIEWDYEVKKSGDLYSAICLWKFYRYNRKWGWKWRTRWDYWREVVKKEQPKTTRCPKCYSHGGHYSNCQTQYIGKK